MKTREIRPRGPISAMVRPPGSKSITNRALPLAALAEGRTVLENALDSEDTRIMFDGLRRLGLVLSHDPGSRRMIVEGRGGPIGLPSEESASPIDLDVGNSGTTARFLTAALCFSGGCYRVHGKPRMHRRPIRDLVDALEPLGADIRFENDDGCPPLILRPPKTEEPVPERAVRTTTVSGSLSSQYLSAVLMTAPLVAGQRDVEIRLTGKPVSRPYIDMTLAVMEAFGVKLAPKNFSPNPFSPYSGPSTDQSTGFRIERGAKYRSPGVYRIEPDASAASYFFAAAAVCGGTVRVPGLSRRSLQGDVGFVDCLEKTGCSVRFDDDSITVSRDPGKPLRGVSVDMNSISDTAQTLAVVALFAEGPTEISNIEHVRFKETDRIADLAAELRRFGAEVEERRDGLRITPPEKLVPATVETYDDHRMAMSFAVAGLRLPGVVIRDPDCTAKTFPGFFEELDRL